MVELTPKEIQLLLLNVMTDIDEFCTENDISYYMIGGTLLGAVRHQGFIPWDDDIDIAMLRSDYNKFIKMWKPEAHANYVLQNTYTDPKCCHTITRILVKGTKLVHNGSYNVTTEHSELFFDIFPLDNVPDTEEARNTQREELLNIKRKIGYKFSKTKSSNAIKQVMKEIRRVLLMPVSYHSLINELNCVAQRFNGQATHCICSMSSQYDYNKQAMDRSIYGTPVRMKFEDRWFLAPAQSDAYLNHLYGDYMKLPPKEKQVFNVRVMAEESLKDKLQ